MRRSAVGRWIDVGAPGEEQAVDEVEEGIGRGLRGLIRGQDHRQATCSLDRRGIGPLDHRHDLVPRIPTNSLHGGTDPDDA